MSYPKPKVPSWPDINLEVEFPEVKQMSLVHKHDSTSKQIWDWLTKRSTYRITEDYFLPIPMMNVWCFIPENFVYDNASIPRVFGFLLRPDGILAYGALPHDFGYRFGGLMLSTGPDHPYTFTALSKSTIDDIFCDLNNKYQNLSYVNSVACWTVDKFAPWHPMDIQNIDWSKPVSRDYYVLI